MKRLRKSSSGFTYHWDEWFAARRFTVRRGADYGVSQSTMCQLIRNVAWELGKSVRLVDSGDSITTFVLAKRNGGRKTA